MCIKISMIQYVIKICNVKIRGIRLMQWIGVCSLGTIMRDCNDNIN